MNAPTETVADGGNGWPALTVPLSRGGQGFPGAAGVFIGEMLASSNLSFSIFASVREKVLCCIDRFGDEQVRHCSLKARER
ncbi:hypothetical protein NS274_08805 [Pseudomonas oryzihabitans]|nr:hypothetical protein NS274_08805 [Pseudomonas psychrotolerans]